MYTSETLSLAVLELFVHLEPTLAPADLVAIPADIPEAVRRSRLAPSALPTDWQRYPAPETLAELGTKWAFEARTAVLVVPSAVVPSEHNYLINPRHPAARAIRVGPSQPFRLDPRLWKP